MSTVKVNTVDKRTGSTLTLGGCGTTVTLGAGATQSGFGRTGTVDWCTTAKTSPFTGVSGTGYFVNTTCGAVTVTLPASPSAGDIISIADYASTWQTNSITLCRNLSKINGSCTNATLNTQGQSITLVYVDGTRGWKNTMDSTSDVTGAAYITATGGTITTCGDYKIHTFTSDGCFSVSAVGNPAGSTTVDYLVVAGGGGNGVGSGGGGGGAGGARMSSGTASGSYTASPLGACVAALPVTVTTYPITVGAGGAANRVLAARPRATRGPDRGDAGRGRPAPPPRHPRLPGAAHRRQRRAGGLGRGPGGRDRGARRRRSAGGAGLSLGRRPRGQEPDAGCGARLHLPALHAGLCLWRRGPPAPAHPPPPPPR